MFNNAGVGGAFGPIGATTVEEWDFTFHVLVRGVFLGIKHASNPMREQANPEGWSGSLINTASIAGIGGGAGPHAYSAAKAAVANLTRAVAAELSAHRIRVNAIAPGMIATPLAVAGKDEPYKRMVEAKQPWPEMGMPQHIADAALMARQRGVAFRHGAGDRRRRRRFRARARHLRPRSLQPHAQEVRPQHRLDRRARHRAGCVGGRSWRDVFPTTWLTKCLWPSPVVQPGRIAGGDDCPGNSRLLGPPRMV